MYVVVCASQQSAVQTVASHAADKKEAVHGQLHGAFDYESDENEDLCAGRITSVRVNRTST
jgi:hypothetical protein